MRMVGIDKVRGTGTAGVEKRLGLKSKCVIPVLKSSQHSFSCAAKEISRLDDVAIKALTADTCRQTIVSRHRQHESRQLGFSNDPQVAYINDIGFQIRKPCLQLLQHMAVRVGKLTYFDKRKCACVCFHFFTS